MGLYVKKNLPRMGLYVKNSLERFVKKFVKTIRQKKIRQKKYSSKKYSSKKKFIKIISSHKNSL